MTRLAYLQAAKLSRMRGGSLFHWILNRQQNKMALLFLTLLLCDSHRFTYNDVSFDAKFHLQRIRFWLMKHE